MHRISWPEIAEYVAAGNIVGLKIEDNFSTVHLEVIYGNADCERHIHIVCFGCSYMDLRRTEEHEPGSGVVLEAYLHTDSPLIQALFAHTLQGKAGLLFLEHTEHKDAVKHLEIIGEISLNILCENVIFTTAVPSGLD